MKKVIIIALLLWFITTPILAKAVGIAHRITDREIIEELNDRKGDIRGLKTDIHRLEDGQRAILRGMDQRFDSMEKQIDNLVSIFIGIVAAFAAIVAITISFAIWDRRTALRPTLTEISEVKEKGNKILKALMEFAQREPKMAEALRSIGLL